MSVDVTIGWVWTSFGLFIGYHKDTMLHKNVTLVQIGFISIHIEKG